MILAGLKLLRLYPIILLAFYSAAQQHLSGSELKDGMILSLTPVFSIPQSGLLPGFYLEKNSICSIDSTLVDSSDSAWFLVSNEKNSGWIKAENLRFSSYSGSPSESNPTPVNSDKDKIHRYGIVREHPDWSRRIQKTVRDGKVCLEMSEEQLKASWGEPFQKNRAFLLGSGAYDVWFYRGSDGKMLMVGLSRGRVIGWSEE